MKLRKLGSSTLVAALIAGLLTFVGVPMAQAVVAPQDVVNVKIISDGTHIDGRPVTYVTTEHGYPVGDDRPDDRVVSSGDIVTYGVTLDIKAGPARTLLFTLEDMNNRGGLDLSGIARVRFSEPLVTQKVTDRGLELQIPRGYAGRLDTTMALRANDTAGKIVEGNKVQYKVINEAAGYESVSISDEITVVSVPLADLTIFTKSNDYNQTNPVGVFTIDPVAIQPIGYSKFGITASGEWHTDVDVSDFPAGTIWTFGGKEVPVVNGLIKDLRGTGRADLTYKLPQDVLDSLADSPQSYEISIQPYEDSFQAGDQKNIPDPGLGEDASFATSKFTHNGVTYNTPNGRNRLNNNFAGVVWDWYESPPGQVFTYSYTIKAPRDRNQTIFDDRNLHWNEKNYSTDAADVTRIRPDNDLTSDGDVVNVLTVNLEQLSEPSATALLNVMNTCENESACRDYRYDSERPVIVRLDGQELDRSLYTNEYFVDGRWILSDVALEGATRARVLLSKEAVAGGARRVEISWPAKTLDSYDPALDGGKHIQSGGGIAEADVKTASARLAFPAIPTSSLRMTQESMSGFDQSGRATFTGNLYPNLRTPSSFEGNVGTIVMTLPDVFDPATFKLQKADGWEIVSVDGQQVTLRREGRNLAPSGSEWSLGRPQFSVQTTARPSGPAGEPISAEIGAELEVDYPAVHPLEAGTTAKVADSVTVSIPNADSVSQFLETVDRKSEIGDPVSWTIAVNAGRLDRADQGWSQEVRMPQNDDIGNWDEINEGNGTNIVIDPETGKPTEDSDPYDGFGRSKFNGDYELSKVTLRDYLPGTYVEFYEKDEAGNVINVVRKEPAADGSIDLTGVQGKPFFRVAGEGIDDVTRTAGANVDVQITPRNNRADDVYVLWLAPIQTDSDKSSGVVAWPDYAHVVESKISGNVYWDLDRNSVREISEGDLPIRDVTVVLERFVNDEWVQVAEQKTSTLTTADGQTESGHFEFATLHSGKYRVVLPNVERGEGATITTGDGDPSDSDRLVASVTNRFGTQIATEQSQSYKLTWQRSASVVELDLGVDSAIENVDFGYVRNNADIALDKSPARVTSNSDGTANVSWDVVVKNTGDMPLDGVELFDRTSIEVKGLSATVSYQEQSNLITGKPLAITGQEGDTDRSRVVATTDGYWVVRSDDFVSKLQADIPGTFIEMTGYLGSGGVGIITSEGYFHLDQNLNVRQVRGVTGTPIALAGLSPLSSGDGSVVATSHGVFLVAGTSVQKVDVPGTPIDVGGDQPTNSRYGSAVITTEGVYLVTYRGAPTKVQGYLGEPKMVSRSTNTLLITTEGSYRIDNSGNANLITGMTGQPRAFGNASTIATSDAIYSIDSSGKATLRARYEGEYVSHAYTYFTSGGVTVRSVHVITTTGFYSFTGDGELQYSNERIGQPVSMISRGTGIAHVLTDEGLITINPVDTVKRVDGIEGEVLSSGGSRAQVADAILTRDGAYLFDPATSRLVQVSNLTGTPISVIGAKKPGSTASLYDLLIATSDGVFYTDQNNVAHRIDGITGTPVAMTGTSIDYAGAGIATTDGYYLFNKGQVTRISDVTGTPIAVTGDRANSSTTIVATTDGIFVVEANGTLSPQRQIRGVTGTPIALTGETGVNGVGIATTDGYFRARTGEQARLVSGISGDIIAVTGQLPFGQFGYGGSAVATSEGVYFVDGAGTAKKIANITGTPTVLSSMTRAAQGKSSFVVGTTDGLFFVDGNAISAQPVPGITGIPTSINGQDLLSYQEGLGVGTTEGYFLVPSQTHRVGSFIQLHDSQSFLEREGSKVVANADGRQFVERSFELPRIEPGQSMQVTLTGSLLRDQEDFVVGNQAWSTSDLTPRAGLETSKVTGDGQQSGVPDVPLLPTPQDLDRNGIHGTPTVSLNSEPGVEMTDSWKPSQLADDVADQTPALIPGKPDQPPLNGSVAGTAWYDINKDGLRSDDEERVVGMTVLVTDPQTGAVLGEAKTAEDGTWLVDRLPVGKEVDVQYGSTGWRYRDRQWSVTTLGEDLAETNNSDATSDGFVDGAKRLVAAENPTQWGQADIGLRVLDGSIDISKALEDGETPDEVTIRGEKKLEQEPPPAPEIDAPYGNADTAAQIYDNDNDPRTAAFTLTIRNDGNENLRDLRLTDQTVTGLDAIILSKLERIDVDGNLLAVDALITEDGVIQVDGKNLTLKPGESLRGAFIVRFSEGNDIHENRVTVNAKIVDSEGTVVGAVSDDDAFKATYTYQAPGKLELFKVDGEDRKTPLKYASFTITATTLADLPDSDEAESLAHQVGTFTTNRNGIATLNLPAGVYRIEETVAPGGYQKPQGVWYVKLAYVNGEQVVTLKAVGDAPYAEANPIADAENHWGRITITNHPPFEPPVTGGLVLWLILASIVVATGAWTYLRFGSKRSKGKHSA